MEDSKSFRCRYKVYVIENSIEELVHVGSTIVLAKKCFNEKKQLLKYQVVMLVKDDKDILCESILKQRKYYDVIDRKFEGNAMWTRVKKETNPEWYVGSKYHFINEQTNG